MNHKEGMAFVSTKRPASRGDAREVLVNLKLPRGIQRKLAFLLLSVALAPLGAFGILAYVNGRASLRQKVGEALEDRAASTVDKLSRNLFDRHGDIQVIAQNPVLAVDISAPEQKSEVLAAMVRTYSPVYLLVSVTDASGTVAGSSEASLVGRNDGGEEWFKNAVRGDVYYSPDVVKAPQPATNSAVAPPACHNACGSALA